jgi:hypothetical protein
LFVGEAAPFVFVRIWERREAENAGCVIEKLGDCDFLSMSRRIGDVFPDVVIETQFALLDELEQDSGLDVLGNRTDVKWSIGCDGD